MAISGWITCEFFLFIFLHVRAILAAWPNLQQLWLPPWSFNVQTISSWSQSQGLEYGFGCPKNTKFYATRAGLFHGH